MQGCNTAYVTWGVRNDAAKFLFLANVCCCFGMWVCCVAGGVDFILFWRVQERRHTGDLVQDNLVLGLHQRVTHRCVSAFLWTNEYWIRLFIECNLIVTCGLMRITWNSVRLKPSVCWDECGKLVKEQRNWHHSVPRQVSNAWNNPAVRERPMVLAQDFRYVTLRKLRVDTQVFLVL
jgi:hypothetical protein